MIIKKGILIIGKNATDGLDDTMLTAEIVWETEEILFRFSF